MRVFASIRYVYVRDTLPSLIPNIFNMRVAESCLRNQRNLITASYIPPDMRAMHKKCAPPPSLSPI